MSPTRYEGDTDEETPLFQNADVPQKPTRLPKAQIFILFSVWLAESTISHSISPYLNQLVKELPIVGGDDRKVGYYSGVIVASHFAAEAVTALHWNRLSDHIGRKPVLLSCFMGVIISIITFGLSRSLWALVLSRCLHGAMKGSTGVLKSMISELTDESNVARGFSVLPVAWSLGCMMGPLIGGVLSRPQDRWPDLFSHPFWASYPYFLPCLAAAALSCLSFITAALFLKETMNTPPMKLQFAKVTSNGSREGPNDTLDEEPSNPKKLLPLRSVLIRPVVISIANYAMLALVSMAATALIPLVWSTSVEFGGLGLRPVSIGLWMSSYGFFNGAFQFAFFPLMARRFGPQRVFVTSVAVCAIIYTMFPLENLAAGGGSKGTVWLLMFLQLLSLSISETGFSSIFLFISSAAPSKRSLGTTMGLAQTVVSVQRAVGPVAADWLFAFSITNNVLGGNLVYVVLYVLVGVGLCVAAQLPRYAWRRNGG